MDVRLPDGTIIQGVPDGISKADLVTKLKANGYDTSGLEPSAPDPQQPLNQTPPTPFTPSGEKSAFRDAMGQFDEALKAITNLNPQTALFRASGEGMKSATDLIEKGAYHVGGAATDLAAQAGASPEVAGGLGYAANVGVQAIPTVVGAALGSAAKPGLQNQGREFMQQAIKPHTDDLASDKAARAIETMLQQGINATPKGMVDTIKKVRGINEQVERQLAGSTETISRSGAASRIQDAANKIIRGDPAPQDALKQVERYYTQVLTNPHTTERLPATVANDLKKGIYKKLSDAAYGQGTPLGAEKEAMKAMARGLKEDLGAKFPEVAKLNAQESELLNVLTVAKNRALVSGNKDFGGIAWLYNNPAAGLAFFADRSAVFKSMLARSFYSAGRSSLPTATGAAAGAAVGYEGAQAP